MTVNLVAPAFIMEYQDIFAESKRRELAEILSSSGYTHLPGAALFWKGQKPVVPGTNHVVRTQGFGRVNCNSHVRDGISIDEIFLGTFSNLSLDVFAPILGSLSFERGPKEANTLAGKLRVQVKKSINGSLMILDRSEHCGLAKNMSIEISFALQTDVRIEICGQAPRVGFSFNLAGPLTCITCFKKSPTIRVEFCEEDGVRVYRLFPQ
jgi:hypothetical protein